MKGEIWVEEMITKSSIESKAKTLIYWVLLSKMFSVSASRILGDNLSAQMFWFIRVNLNL